MSDIGATNKPHLGKRIIEQRAKNGLSQEALANLSGLSLRTVQRIEKGESIPRGATLKKLAQVLTINAEELIDLDLDDDPNILTLLNLSQIACLIFPLLGLVVPLAIWITQRNRIQHLNTLGISILNFQILWNLLVFATYGLGLFAVFVNKAVSESIFNSFVVTLAVLYLYVIALSIWNTVLSHKKQTFWYKPTIPLLR